MMAATAAVYNRLHNSSLSGGSGSGLGHHSQLARSLERILEEAHLSGELILTNRKLKDFPKTATKYSLTDTVIADLSRNRFCELPEEITTFSFLETLLVFHNAIRLIPESVKHLTSLTYLDLRSNQLSSLPREICFLPLQVLLISNNRLTSLPDEMGRMDRLTDLDASYNQLTALPARIGELRSLRSLSLRSNQLMYLPRELTCLTLVSLDVSSNRIAGLPLEIRQMSTLVEFNLENNPLTSPPASLCVRGLVHVFKYLETQANKEEKGSRAGGNYDGYTTLRRAPRNNSSGIILDSNRVPRHHVDSGYSTCDGIDKRWSHDMPSVKTKVESPIRKPTPTTPPSSLSNDLMDASLTSSTNTIVDESISLTAAVVKPLNAMSSLTSSPIKTKDDQSQQQLSPLLQHINYTHSSSSNGSTPDHEDRNIIDNNHPNNKQMSPQQQQRQTNVNGKMDEKLNKNLGNIQTYREYKEALKQQRNQEISSVYKMKGQKVLYDMDEAIQPLSSNNITPSPPHEDIEIRFNGGSKLPKSIMKNGANTNTNTNGNLNGLNGSNNNMGSGGSGCAADETPKRPIQKVIPSRNTELTSANSTTSAPTTTMGECIGYVKPNSPMKTFIANGQATTNGVLTNNNKLPPTGSNLKSPVGNGTKFGANKTQRTVTWNRDIPSEKLSFTMRREFDRQREETELMTQLRSIIETRLKMTLPEDIASALTDGVILCHLANYVRPRSVASIHVPSPGISKLTMARCRRNVDNFLEACRKIGVDEELICSCEDVLPLPSSSSSSSSSPSPLSNQHDYLNDVHNMNLNNNMLNVQNDEYKLLLKNPKAVARTILALIAMDTNPNHQNIMNIQQQYELQMLLQDCFETTIQTYKQQQQHHQMPDEKKHIKDDHDNYEQLKQTDDFVDYHYAQHHQQQQQQQHEQINNVEHCDDIEQNNHHQQQQFNQRKLHFDYEQKYYKKHRQQQQQEQQQQQQTATVTKSQQLHRNLIINYNNDEHTKELSSYEHLSDSNNVHNDNTHNNYDSNNMMMLITNNNDNSHMNKLNNYDANHHYEESAELIVKHSSSSYSNVTNFLKNAKLKTFQKIKFNLITSHGNNNCNNGCNNNTNICTSLQTIVETDCDGVNNLCNGNMECDVVDSVFRDDGYQLINEKATSTATAKSMANGLKDEFNGGRNISKRIEFFEHSVTSTKSPSITTAAGPTTVASSMPTTATATTLMNNSLVEPMAKSKTKTTNIFSIYRVDNASDNKLLKTVTNQHVEKDEKSSSSKSTLLLKHDSNVLTIVLSCIFIATFLLLVYFPIPG